MFIELNGGLEFDLESDGEDGPCVLRFDDGDQRDATFRPGVGPYRKCSVLTKCAYGVRLTSGGPCAVERGPAAHRVSHRPDGRARCQPPELDVPQQSRGRGAATRHHGAMAIVPSGAPASARAMAAPAGGAPLARGVAGSLSELAGDAFSCRVKCTVEACSARDRLHPRCPPPQEPSRAQHPRRRRGSARF